VASLGEYEQVVPVIQNLKKQFKQHAFLISFFSDSGYQAKKNKSIGDFETYIPLDTPKQSKAFVEKVNPKFALFVKYDIWPNYLKYLKSKDIKVFLVAARFRPNQIYFKSYASIFKQALQSFQQIFVQDQASGHLLNSIGYTFWKHSGDTRYDRVSLQLEQDNHLDFMENFLQNEKCMVCGSTWSEGETFLLPTINDKSIKQKYVIAPHQINKDQTDNLTQLIKKPTIKYSEISNQDLSKYDVLIVDTIGLLTKIYAYAHIAYVGGAVGNTGLHNILEPAAFGVPILIGPHHKKFPEAKALEEHGGLYVVRSAKDTHQIIRELTDHSTLNDKMSQASKTFITSQKGATEITVKGILENLSS
jgi:3-deoxy-D-manno-octulosonic-acid transferase